MSSNPPISIAIIGAGIAGITLAIAISKHNPNLHLTIFESRSEFSEIGAGVGLGPNAVQAMKLIDAGVYEAHEAVKDRSRSEEKEGIWFDIRYGDGPMAGEMMTDAVAHKDFDHGGVGRAVFLNELVKLLPSGVKVVFEKKVVDVQEIGDRMKVVFADGEEVAVDAVIGCDGVRSACRTIMLGGYEAVYSGKYAYRKVIPMAKAVAAVGEEVQNRTIYSARGGHILMFPIKGGQLLNLVVFRDSEGQPWMDKKWVIPSTREEVLKDFERWGQKCTNLLELITDPDKWALYDHPAAPTYVKGNFCLVGDAAHAMTPHSGAGAGMAIEDAHMLSALLTPDLIKSRADIKYALKAYDQVRRPRSQQIVTRSRRQGRMLDLQNEDGGIPTKEELKSSMESNMKWIWGVELQSMVAEGRNLALTYTEKDV